MITVTPFDGDDAEWNGFVTRDPTASYCHLSAWRGVIAEGLGHRWLAWGARDPSGRLHGLLSAVQVKSALLGNYLVSLPFLNGGGPIGTARAKAALAEAAIAEAKRTGADLLELRTRDQPPEPLALSNRKITVLLDLPSTVEGLWNRFPSKLRSQIKRGQGAGLTVRFGPDERPAFYDVFVRNMHALGTPALPAEHFARIAEAFPKQVVFGAVYRGNSPIAAGCGFLWHQEFEMTWASSLRAESRLAPNMVLYWESMSHAIAQGAKVFNFGRCTPDSGTHAFKRQWGGRDVPLPWGQWSDSAVTAPPTPSRPLFKFASACWRRIPVGVAARIGPNFARLLP
ncbi:MAG: GNAT family N-acetyltransferase [Gemmatimonadales bacterium]